MIISQLFFPRPGRVTQDDWQQQVAGRVMVLKQGFWNWLLGSDPHLPQLRTAARDYSLASPHPIYLDCLSDLAVPLLQAVEEFNGRAALDDVGKVQTPLTVDEVVTA